MPKQSKYIQSLLEFQAAHKEIMRQIINATDQEQESILARIMEEEMGVKYSLGERLADKVAGFGGSWTFIIYFLLFTAVWVVYNLGGFAQKPFDPYPFILLNLMLSCVAALQAPVILMSQNRKEARDRKRAQDDYMVNLKAELKSRGVDKKLDLLINELFRELIEIQATQLKKLDRLENVMVKLHPVVKNLLRPQ